MLEMIGRCSFDESLTSRGDAVGFPATFDEQPGRTAVVVRDSIAMVTRLSWCHGRVNAQRQLLCDGTGNVVSVSGHIHNRADLMNDLDIDLSSEPDATLVLCAYVRWGRECFSRFVGEWSIALWSKADQTLYLACDHAGTRTLYYCLEDDRVTWATRLDLLRDLVPSKEIDPEYVVSYITLQASPQITPYESIRSVPAACYLEFRRMNVQRRVHWSFPMDAKVRRCSEGEYDEQFLQLFQKSISRRLNTEECVVGELSGGMDSTSIVCLADLLAAARGEERIPTVSYYDDSEPNWDERPYFSIVEAYRGRVGKHLDVRSSEPLFEIPDWDRSVGEFAIPGLDKAGVASLKSMARFIQECGYTTVLSGVGGDELLGGVSTPFPELADYLADFEFKSLLASATNWCRQNHTPLCGLLAGTAKYTLGLYLAPRKEAEKKAPWISSKLKSLAKARREPLAQEFRGRPSAVAGAYTWHALLGSLPRRSFCDYSFPYLDRDFIEFLCTVPRFEILSYNRRRRLMRRALKGIVPVEILERRRKAFVSRGPLVDLRESQKHILALFKSSVSAELGFVEPSLFREALQLAINGGSSSFLPIFRTVALEVWLRTAFSLKTCGATSGSPPSDA
jgi:asparagine synthase (glutamine-hydrolysing)